MVYNISRCNLAQIRRKRPSWAHPGLENRLRDHNQSVLGARWVGSHLRTETGYSYMVVA